MVNKLKLACITLYALKINRILPIWQKIGSDTFVWR